MNSITVLLLATAAIGALAFRPYRLEIPNGLSVRHPCKPGELWEGVGHQYEYGTGPRSAFGEAFAAAGHTWTQALCQADSDQDGVSNGAELGDPKCVWRKGVAASGPAISHPGVCEPVNSNKCIGKNTWPIEGC